MSEVKRSAIAMLEIAKDTAHALSHDGDFITKSRPSKEGEHHGEREGQA